MPETPEHPASAASAATTGSNEPRRTFWQRRVVDPAVAQLTQGITPEKIALTIAIGSSFALFPMLGVTTFLCLMAGIALRLNQPMIQAVNYLCTPIHIPLIWWMVRTGEWLFGEEHHAFKMKVLANLLWEEPMKFLHLFGKTILHASVVWAILVPFWALTVYRISLPILREAARVRVSVTPKGCGVDPSADDPKHPVP